MGVNKLLKELNTNKAMGPDRIPTRVLKEAADEIAPVVAFIFNETLNNGVLLTDWALINIPVKHN